MDSSTATLAAGNPTNVFRPIALLKLRESNVQTGLVSAANLIRFTYIVRMSRNDIIVQPFSATPSVKSLLAGLHSLTAQESLTVEEYSYVFNCKHLLHYGTVESNRTPLSIGVDP